MARNPGLKTRITKPKRAFRNIPSADEVIEEKSRLTRTLEAAVLNEGKLAAGETVKPGASEALSSHVGHRFDLLPRPFLVRVASRFEVGDKKYPPFNYARGLNDKQYVLDRINHLIAHLNHFLWPQTDDEWEDDNLAAIGWAVAFLMLCNPALIWEIRKERSKVMNCLLQTGIEK